MRVGFPAIKVELQITAIVFKQSWNGFLLISVLQVKLYVPIEWENTKILFERDAGPEERHSRDVSAGGMPIAGVTELEQPQMTIDVFSAKILIPHLGLTGPERPGLLYIRL